MTENEALLQMAREAAGNTVLADNGFTAKAVIPSHCAVHEIDTSPQYIKETVDVTTADGFVTYFEKFDSQDTMVFYEDLGSDSRIVARFDYHRESNPNTNRHTACLHLRETPEFHMWNNNNGKWRSHLEFVEFFELNAEAILDPSAADLAEIISSFKVVRAASFENTVANKSGVSQFRYEEKDKMSTVALPDNLKLQIPILNTDRDDVATVTANLRYRIKDGKLTLSYHINGLERAVRIARDRQIEKIEERIEQTIIH